MDHRAEVQHWLDGCSARMATTINAEDILGSLAYAGDDGHEFMEEFAAQFKVDLSAFNPWHHYDADEPPMYRRYLPYSTAGKELPDLAITVADLAAAAASGRWMMDYSDRELRRSHSGGPLLPLLAIAIVFIVMAVVF
jgi:Protein of unknown function (DUF1493)